MSDRRLVTTSAAEVRPRAMRFLMRPWLPLGEITLLAGEPGLGKSTLVCHYAAAASRGELPGDLTHNPCPVLIAGTEESAEATVVPRLLAAGAVLGRVHFLAAEQDGRPAPVTIPDDLDLIEERLAATGARLVTFDPLSAFLTGKVNSWREHDVRRALAALSDVARQADAAFLGIVHLNKGDADKLLQRVGGSAGFAAAARSVIAFGRDPADPDARGARRIIAHAKCNVAPEAEPLAAVREPVTVTLEDGTVLHDSRLVITGRADVEADDLLTDREDYTARGEAVDFLLAELADGPVPTKQLKARAEDAGLSWRTVERAKPKAGARARKVGTDGWVWEITTPSQYPLGGVDGLGGLQGSTDTAKAAKAAKAATHSVEDPPLATPAEQAEIDRLLSQEPSP